MAYEHKVNRGSMFANEKTRDNAPDSKGDAKIECPHCKQQFDAWVSGWRNEKNGKRWLSLAIDPKANTPQSKGAPYGRTETPPEEPDFSDEIPF